MGSSELLAHGKFRVTFSSWELGSYSLMMGTSELLSHHGKFRVTFLWWELQSYFLMIGTSELLSHDGNFRVTFSWWEIQSYFLTGTSEWLSHGNFRVTFSWELQSDFHNGNLGVTFSWLELQSYCLTDCLQSCFNLSACAWFWLQYGQCGSTGWQAATLVRGGRGDLQEE